MKAMDMLADHLETRLADLEKAKKEGRKIIGYTLNNFGRQTIHILQLDVGNESTNKFISKFNNPLGKPFTYTIYSL